MKINVNIFVIVDVPRQTAKDAIRYGFPRRMFIGRLWVPGTVPDGETLAMNQARGAPVRREVTCRGRVAGGERTNNQASR